MKKDKIDGCGGRKGGLDCGGFLGGLEMKWDIGKKTSQLRRYKRKKSRKVELRSSPKVAWKVGNIQEERSWESCTRGRIWDEVTKWGIGRWAFIVYQDSPLANPEEEEETRLSSCLSFSTSLCIPVPESSFQFFLIHTSGSQESLGFYSPLKLPLNQTQGQSRLEVIF